MTGIVAGTVFALMSLSAFAIAAICFRASKAFERKTSDAVLTGGRLVKVKHRKNAHLLVSKGFSHHITDKYVKNVTKALYVYSTDDRDYKIWTTFYFCTPRQIPRLTTVVYYKRFPRIAYVKSGISAFDIYSFVAAFFAVMLLIAAVSCFFA